LLGHCSFDKDHWETYVTVNQRFAEVVAKHIEPDSFVWIHDYQLLLVGHFLRELGVEQHLGFFLHIPFPALDLLRRLPWKSEIMHGLLDYDHIGFQTAHDRRNFIHTVRWFIPDSKIRARRRESTLTHRGRKVKLGFYPISIDFNEFAQHADTHEVAEAAWYLRENVHAETVVLGLDRLDYTKGMPERFLAFERLLEKYEDLRGKISLIQVVIPSRVRVREYQLLKEELDTLAGRINGRFGMHGWMPIQYMFRSLDRTQLLGHYRGCGIALITPLRDGMNLVSKEYCAASIDNQGVLILSEFAGAADQLGRGALVVNPYDVEGTADAIYQAYIMSPEERERRMKMLRAEVKRNDVHRWVQWFLGAEDHTLRESRRRDTETVT
jgi:trehalose 6-phosphate synthase